MIAITKRLFLMSPLAVLAGKAFGRQQDPNVVLPKLDDAKLAPVVAKAVNDYMLPAYAGLKAATASLVEAMNGFCAAPAATPSPAVRDAFAAVLLAWAKVDFLRFGPISDQGRHERFSFLPDPHGTGARQLRKILASPDPALLEPGAVAKLSAAVQGMPALEALLFGEASDTETLSYRCALSLRIAENLDQIAAETLSGWQGDGGWARQMLSPGGDNITYRDGTEPVVEILKAMGVGLLQLRDQRLLPALSASFAQAKPNRGVFVRSGLTLPYLDASGKAIAALIDTSDILSLAPDQQAALDKETDVTFAIYDGAVETKRSWAEIFADEAAYDRLRKGFDSLKVLEDIYNYRFPVAAGISPGFNALDGD